MCNCTPALEIRSIFAPPAIAGRPRRGPCILGSRDGLGKPFLLSALKLNPALLPDQDDIEAVQQGQRLRKGKLCPLNLVLPGVDTVIASLAQIGAMQIRAQK